MFRFNLYDFEPQIVAEKYNTSAHSDEKSTTFFFVEIVV